MLIGHRQIVSAGDSVEHVFETFRHSDLEFLAIVDGERLLGMCSRHAIDSLLGGRYGFSLWARKAIAEHVAANETRIVVSSAITDVLRKVFARNPENFYDDVLLVDEDGRLLGLISTETLFKVQNALLLANISQLEKKEREIREKNEQMESELRMAMELQQAMMPKTEPLSLRKAGSSFPHFDHRYVAAGLVGGDFFHIVRLSDSAASVFICDVMGHGVSSALITAMLRALIEGCGADAADPSVLMTHLNSEFTKILRQTDTVLFATAFYCVLDADRANFGTHEPGIRVLSMCKDAPVRSHRSIASKVRRVLLLDSSILRAMAIRTPHSSRAIGSFFSLTALKRRRTMRMSNSVFRD